MLFADIVLVTGKTTISKQQPLFSRSEQHVVKSTTVVITRTASIYLALNCMPILVSNAVVPSLQREQLRSKEVRKLAQDYRAGMLWSGI